MGCFWSSEDNSRDYCVRCKRRAVNNLIIVDHLCEVCISVSKKNAASRSRIQQSSNSAVRPCFGEYRCSCGRTWGSRLSWKHAYQICKRCQNQVYPHSQRQLRPSDTSQDKESFQEHQKELCQMCQQLGYYCGRIGRNNIREKTYRI